jgi:hypothetical protein
MKTQDLAVAIRDMMNLNDEVELEDGYFVAIDVHLDESNLHVTAATGEQFRVSIVRVG